MAKGRLVGVQFDALFTDDLYFRISRHAIEMAERMKVDESHTVVRLATSWSTTKEDLSALRDALFRMSL